MRPIPDVVSHARSKKERGFQKSQTMITQVGMPGINMAGEEMMDQPIRQNRQGFAVAAACFVWVMATAPWLEAREHDRHYGASMEVPQASSPETDDPQLQKLVDEALKNNPGLKAARLNVEAADAGVAHHRFLDPPQVGVEFFQTPIQSFPNPLKDQMEVDYSVQQMLPFPGKRRAMVRAEAKRVDMRREEAKVRRNRIIQELKSKYYELHWLDARRKINAENKDWMNRFLAIARKQYEVGMGRQADILRAQTELSALANEGIAIEQTRRTMEGMLNALLNRKVNQPFDTLPAFALPPRLSWTFDQLSNLVVESQPDLKAMEAGIRMGKAELVALKREFWPDFMVRGMYKDMQGTSDDFWALMVGVDIPVAFWSIGKYQANYSKGRTDLRRLEQEYLDMKNMALARVQEALLKVEANWNLVTLARTSQIPQSEQTLQSTLSAYQTGKTEFLMLLDAYKMSLMAKLDYEMAVMQLMQSRAELEEAMGLPLREIASMISSGNQSRPESNKESK